MLLHYKKRANVAGIAFLASLGLLVAFPVLVDGRFWHDHPLPYLPLVIVFSLSFWYWFWATAKAKGYAGWVGLILPFFSVVGLLILLLLKDKHKAAVGDPAVHPSVPRSAQKNVTDQPAQSEASIETRLAQLEVLLAKGLITQKEFDIKREQILDGI